MLPIVVEGKDFFWASKGQQVVIPFERGACMDEAHLALCSGVEQ